MTKAPLISVVMPVYNVERYLGDAVESVLNQTFSDFEFIIIEDPSTDRTSEILDEYAEQDKRIRLIRNSRPLGLVRSLNNGFNLTCGTYIARQDADDISQSERFALQVRFLEEHPEVGVVGTWLSYIDEEGMQTGVWRAPVSPALVKWSLLFGTCLAHPTVMMRRSLTEGDVTYRPDMLHAEDYDLWIRLSDKTKLANVPQSLFLRRVHKEMIGTKYSVHQEQTVRKIMQQNIVNLLGEDIQESFIEIFRRVIHKKVVETQTELVTVSRFIEQLFHAHVARNILSKAERDAVAEDAARRLVQLALSNNEHWPASSTRILLKALCLNWRVINRSHIITIIHNLLKPLV